MTKQERLKAFEMRLDGCNWSEIGRQLGYTSNTVREDLLSCILSSPYRVRCVYPALRSVIEARYGGSISAFAGACGISYNTMYCMLTGKREIKGEKTADICAAAGLSPSEAFQREED